MSRRSVATGFAAAALLAMAATIAACGFRPMYGDRPGTTAGTPLAADLAAVEVAPIPDRTGQVLRNSLQRLLQPGEAGGGSRYTLRIDLEETEDTFAVERTGFATRGNIELVARYALVEDVSGKALTTGTSRAVSGFNLLDNDFSTYTARGDAQRRAAERLAQEIRGRVAAHLAKSGVAGGGT